MTDPDADWHKSNSNNFIVGYATQNAVDHNSRMFVYQKVVTEQNDAAFTIDMVEEVEELKAALLPQKTDEIKYALDSGYASEDNLVKLEKRDIYMPDREYKFLEEN